MQNKPVRLGPFKITSSVGNLVNPPTLTGGTGLDGVNADTYLLITKITIVNTQATPTNISLYIGATGGSASGTEFWLDNFSLPAYTPIGWSGKLRIDVADFLTGVTNQNTVTVEMDAEIGIV